jgi:hypothetical protein
VVAYMANVTDHTDILGFTVPVHSAQVALDCCVILALVGLVYAAYLVTRKRDKRYRPAQTQSTRTRAGSIKKEDANSNKGERNAESAKSPVVESAKPTSPRHASPPPASNRKQSPAPSARRKSSSAPAVSVEAPATPATVQKKRASRKTATEVLGQIASPDGRRSSRIRAKASDE